ncbi:MAG: ABC transporter permease [bacterium JZ-2024 1]
MNSLKELWASSDLIGFLVWRDLKVRYKGTVLGFFWSFLTPLLIFLLYYFIFSLLTDRFGMERYDVYLLSGLWAWIFFQRTVAHITPIFRQNGHFLRMVYFPRLILPLTVVLGESIHFFAGIFILLLFVFVRTGHFPAGILLLPCVFVLHMLFAFSVGLLFATSAVYFRDTENIVNLLLTFWFFASPVFYQVDSVVQKLPELFQGISPSLGSFALSLYLLNPLVPLLQMYQSIFYHFQLPPGNLFALLSFWTILVLLVSLSLFSAHQGKFAEEL